MATDTLEPHELDSVSSLPLRQRTELIGHTASVAAVAFNSNGEYCLSASYDKTIRLWNPYTSKLIKVYRGHGYQVVDVVVVMGLVEEVTCSRSEGVVWNEKKKLKITCIPHRDGGFPTR
eukprot:TRINITY_DN9840_c0_g1_i3.p1 TRINITY_DN9840_c0_g1~~TRINITY_DN9840_c0_g1_i3.p1  ORF type:complete len:119 (+),score=14.59 TRINITY_DN9840_c0_g1_i3:330-686(+)